MPTVKLNSKSQYEANIEITMYLHFGGHRAISSKTLKVI